MKRWLFGLATVAVVSGCEDAVKNPMRVTLPAPAGLALGSVGIPMTTVENELLSTIGSSPQRSIVIQQEWERAPDMLMVSMNNLFSANLDQRLQFLPELGPIERDFVSCGRTTVGSSEFPIATAPRYTTPIIALSELPDGSPNMNDTIELMRGGATITGLSIRPQPNDGSAATTTRLVDGTIEATSFNLAVSLSNLSFDFKRQGWDYKTTIGSVAVSCVGTIELETRNIPGQYVTCGEQRVRCLPGTVNVTTTGFNTTFPGFLQVAAWMVGEPLLRAYIHEAALMGITLHQQNWAISSMSFKNDAERSLHIVATSTINPADPTRSTCSPVPPPLPPSPPSRGLLEAWGIAGEGEIISHSGYVKPFASIPVVHMRARDSKGRLHTFVEGNDLVNRRAVGGEFRPEPYGVNEIITGFSRREEFSKEACWVKPATAGTLVFVAPRESLATVGGKVMSESELEELSARPTRITSVTSATPEEAAAIAKQLGIDCGKCTGWTRVTGIIARPDGRPWANDVPPGQTAPWELDVWISRDAAEVEAMLRDHLSCIETYGEEEVGRRHFTLARVGMYDTYFDSSALNSIDYGRSTASSRWAFESNFMDGAKTRRFVGLAEACPADGSICWEAGIAPPRYGTASVIVAASETSVPRLDVRDAVSSVGGTVAAYGSRQRAAWGYFDRSAVELYTRVPAVYRRAGIVADGYDYRGSADLDWNHEVNTFPEPNSQTHVDGSRPTWLNSDPRPGESYQGNFTPYFADWKTDELQLRRRRAGTASFCAMPDQLSARLSRLRFVGAGLSNNTDVPMSLIAPTNSGNDVVITGTQTVNGQPRLSVP